MIMMPSYPDLHGVSIEKQIEILEDSYIRLSRFLEEQLASLDGKNFTPTFNRNWKKTTEGLIEIKDGLTSMEGDVGNIQDAMGTMVSDISLLTGQIGSIDGDLSALNGQMTVVQQNITTIEANASGISANVSSLTNRVTTVEGDITTLDGQVTSISGEVITTQEDIARLDLTASGLNTSVSSLTSQITTLETDIHETQEAIDRAQQAADAAMDAALDAAGIAGGKVTTFYQDDTPTATTPGDLWIDTNDGNKLHRWSGSAWTAVQDAQLQEALNAAGDAQATADQKIRTFAQSAAPTGMSAGDIGDLWIDTNDGNKLYRWDGSSWIEVQDGMIDAVKDIAEGKGKVIIQSGAPAAADRLPQNLWIDTTNGANTPKRWNGSAWVEVTDKAAKDAAAAAVAAQNLANEAKDAAQAAQEEFTEWKNTEFNVWAGGVDIDVEWVKYHTIGGARNLFKNTGFNSPDGFLTNWTKALGASVVQITETTAVSGYCVGISTSEVNGGIYYSSDIATKLEAGKTYTVSFYARTSQGTEVIKSWRENSGSSTNFSLTGSWQRYSYTFTQSTNKTGAVIFYHVSGSGLFYLHSIKVEEGSKPTAWVAAPEDTNSIMYDSAYYRFRSDGFHVYSGAITIWDGTPDSPGNMVFHVDEDGSLVLRSPNYNWVAGGGIRLYQNGGIDMGFTLYSGPWTASGPYNLLQSVSGFRYIEIIYRTVAGAYGSKKVYAVAGTTVNIMTAEAANGVLYIDSANVGINENSITMGAQTETAVQENGNVSITDIAGLFRIVRVIGY